MFKDEEIEVLPGTLAAEVLGAGPLTVRSGHHQAVDVMGEGLQVVARAQDGVVEGTQAVGRTWILGLRWHPEDPDGNEDDFLRALVRAFLAEVRRRRGSTGPVITEAMEIDERQVVVCLVRLLMTAEGPIDDENRARAGQYYTSEERRRLEEMFRAGKDLPTLAVVFERSQVGIAWKLLAEGSVRDSAAVREKATGAKRRVVPPQPRPPFPPLAGQVLVLRLDVVKSVDRVRDVVMQWVHMEGLAEAKIDIAGLESHWPVLRVRGVPDRIDREISENALAVRLRREAQTVARTRAEVARLAGP
ncbi:gamma-glutamyl-gamma-aminobutyrate hydrolase family protein [Brevibacterium litoralis]|uniref:gamma-glutamyl-gamma-aminobutyrate hydrolase family protein n=1 Tax=Brevibacterium litoralis TaxID=3138935 RepID=UPI0032EAAC9B